MAQTGLLHSVHDDEESIMDCFVAVAPRNDREMKNGGAFPVIASTFMCAAIHIPQAAAEKVMVCFVAVAPRNDRKK